MTKAILYDATLCVNCKACEAACAEAHQLPYDDTVAAEATTSDHKLTVVLARGESYMRRMCMHCEDPTCASVCPVAALRKTPQGPVVYEEARCMGCRYCMLACPFGVPKYEWNRMLPGVRKCDLCAGRLAQGLPTACSEICPTGATITGDRDALVSEAQKRIRDDPSRYVNHVYGLSEVGGTSVLMISGVPFEEFGYRTDLDQQPLPLLTYRVLSRLPDLVVLGGVALGGVWWITSRREEVAAAEGGAPAPGAGAAGDGGER
jgi:formate dehydrogenase iron-sulfur subunit